MKALVKLLIEFAKRPQVQAALVTVYEFLTRYKYTSDRVIVYVCPHTGKTITVPIGFPSDGATFVWDIDSDSWWVHDKGCMDGTWDDGTPITAFEAARVLGTILWKEGRKIRAVYWGIGTFIFGCGKAKANGWW